MPSQSATRRSPGLPAIARLFSVRAVNDEEVNLEVVPARRPASGRIVRSRNGCWSSSSSRFLACIDPSWVRRAWTGSTLDLPARPMAMNRIAAAAEPATRMGIRVSMPYTSMSTMRRMIRKPTSIMSPPIPIRIMPTGIPRKLTAGSSMGSMKDGAMTLRNPTRAIGRKATT